MRSGSSTRPWSVRRPRRWEPVLAEPQIDDALHSLGPTVRRTLEREEPALGVVVEHAVGFGDEDREDRPRGDPETLQWLKTPVLADLQLRASPPPKRDLRLAMEVHIGLHQHPAELAVVRRPRAERKTQAF